MFCVFISTPWNGYIHTVGQACVAAGLVPVTGWWTPPTSMLSLARRNRLGVPVELLAQCEGL